MNALIVRRGEMRVPFSRGILSRSLLRLGLDATMAYDIAKRIEADLRRESMSELSTAHLARVLSQHLKRHVGEEFGARYEKLRLFKRSPRPLVLLVGGSTGSGKSTVATEVAHRLDITRIQSTDSVRHIMRSMISERLLPSIHRSSFQDGRGTALPSDPSLDVRVAGLLEQVQHVSVAIDAVLERAVQENLSTIVEGVHLVPGLFERFAREPRLHFAHVVVHVGGEDSHRHRFMARGRAAAGRPGSRYIENFESIRAIQSFLVERARLEEIPCVENDDLDSTVQTVIGHILEGVADSSPIVTRQRS